MNSMDDARPARAAAGIWLSVVAVLVAVLAVAVGARIDVAIPGTPVPQSLQTLAVVVVGGVLGLRLGSLALLAYLVAGAVGAPVFAGGAGGAAALTGPTAGYLVGFVLGAALMGRLADRGLTHRFGGALVGAVAAHLVILLAGWSWLAFDLGAGSAWTGGVAPFLVGGVVKSAVAAVLLVYTFPRSSISRISSKRARSSSSTDGHSSGNSFRVSTTMPATVRRM